MLSNVDIAAVMAKTMPRVRYTFVFNNDHIQPDRVNIINLSKPTVDNPSPPGTHWTVLIPIAGGGYCYCDSFGFVPDARVERETKGGGGELFYNTTQMQERDSVRCGWFVLLAINRVHDLRSMVEFSNTISEKNVIAYRRRINKLFSSA